PPPNSAQIAFEQAPENLGAASEKNGTLNHHPQASPPLPLAQEHLDDLRRSGLSDDTIRAAGLHTIKGDDVSRRLGWNGGGEILGPCLGFPFFDLDGNRLDYVRLKPSRPRSSKDGKPVKYESPKGSSNIPYFPPGTRAALADSSRPLFITEG